MKIGRTIGWADDLNLVDLVNIIMDLGGNAFQTYLTPLNNSSPGRTITKEQSKELYEILKSTGIYVVAHGKLTYNFCRTTEKWQINALVNELNKAHLVSPWVGVVIHQGKNVLKLSRKDALSNYVNNVKEVLDKTPHLKNPIFMENSCQQGTEIGYTLEELGEIWSMFKSFPDFKKKYEKRLGYCLDTCHIFVSGTLGFSSIKEVDDFMLKFDQLIGLKYLKLIHYNDSKCKFDGHNDRHEDLTLGYIGDPRQGGNPEAFQRVLPWADKYDIPVIMETPMKSIECDDQIRMVRGWSKDKVDPPLPIGDVKTKTKKKIVIKKK